MKRSPPWAASSGASDSKTMKVVRSEVQEMIEQGDLSLGNGTKLQDLIDNLQRQVDYESSIEKLEARLIMFARRDKRSLAFMAQTQKKSPQPDASSVDTDRSRFEDETMETTLETIENVDKNGLLFQIMETTENALNKGREDDQALTAAIADVSRELSPPVLTPYGSPQAKGVFVKKEPKEESFSPVQRKETRLKVEPLSPPALTSPKRLEGRQKVECLSPGVHNGPNRLQLKLLQHPPLPPTPFPSVLDSAAASYNVPHRPEVHVGLIKTPPRISVLWNVPEDDPAAPPMESFCVYMSFERTKGSSRFRNWSSLGEVRAIKMPMMATISKFKPGHKVLVTVVGKDKFGRYGPYSEVQSKALPD